MLAEELLEKETLDSSEIDTILSSCQADTEGQKGSEPDESAPMDKNDSERG